eukprot:TRINITY_DN2963_c0_g1_i1.p1 TRINITY_DN2963_c0_g1~~TRINITY_DN2963_c0_g1_i1.p1  ORF type:complete len:456 (+),score=102.96 TRINITY_DN2963_c0_g1_i1:78-1370(+)
MACRCRGRAAGPGAPGYRPEQRGARAGRRTPLAAALALLWPPAADCAAPPTAAPEPPAPVPTVAGVPSPTGVTPPEDDGDNTILLVVLLVAALLLVCVCALLYWYKVHSVVRPEALKEEPEAEDPTERRLDPVDGKYKLKGEYLQTEGRTHEDWLVAELAPPGYDPEKVDTHVAPLEQVPREALPLNNTEFKPSTMATEYKEQAKVALEQMRKGQDFYDRKEKEEREEAERRRKEQEEQARQSALEDMKQRILAGMSGGELDDAFKDWRKAQGDERRASKTQPQPPKLSMSMSRSGGRGQRALSQDGRRSPVSARRAQGPAYVPAAQQPAAGPSADSPRTQSGLSLPGLVSPATAASSPPAPVPPGNRPIRRALSATPITETAAPTEPSPLRGPRLGRAALVIAAQHESPAPPRSTDNALFEPLLSGASA